MYQKIIAFLFILFCLNQATTAQKPEIGDAGFKVDKTKFDPRFPAMKHWVKAGVEGGIPTTKRKIIRVSKIDQIQPAIDKLSKSGGVVLLRNGNYNILKTIRLRNNVILRGESKDKVKLYVFLHGIFRKYTTDERVAAIEMKDVNRVAVENMTIKYAAATFEPNDRDSMQAPWSIDVYHQCEMRDSTLFVILVNINNARNCWVQDCNLLWAGDDPIRIYQSEHITCRRNFIDRCYNKCDGGMGYYSITNSKYVLICNEKVRRIRHLAIQNGSKYVVVIDNELEIDINFHNGDAGDNLIESNHSVIPVWHSWNPIAIGDKSKHQPPGSGNVLYNNSFTDKHGKLIHSDAGVVYLMANEWGAQSVIKSKTLQPPITFYPVIYPTKKR